MKQGKQTLREKPAPVAPPVATVPPATRIRKFLCYQCPKLDAFTSREAFIEHLNKGQHAT